MFFGIFVLSRVLILSIFVLNRVSFLRQEPITLFLDDKQPALMFYQCLKLGIKNRNSVLNRVGKSAIFVLNRVGVWGAKPHLPTQGYIEYPSPPGHHWQLAEGSRGRQRTYSRRLRGLATMKIKSLWVLAIYFDKKNPKKPLRLTCHCTWLLSDISSR